MLFKEDVNLYHEWQISGIFGLNIKLSEFKQWFLHDTFIVGSNGKNNTEQILMPGIVQCIIIIAITICISSISTSMEVENAMNQGCEAVRSESVSFLLNP